MKTIRHYVNKIYLLGIIFLFPAFTLTACNKVTPPVPSENPVFLTAEAQTKTITVENWYNMGRENVTDKITDGYGYTTIENDWISLTKFYSLDDALLRKTLEIKVRENTTTEPRSYRLELGSQAGEEILLITQAGKGK